jgi:GNAT superfamily N-acetyltransferase
MHRATPDELPHVMALLDQRTEWLRTLGTDQWSTRAFAPVMRGAIERGETWLLWDGDDAIATLSLTTIADKDFWTRDERLEPAFYLSKLATHLDRRGAGLGALLIDWAADYANARGVLWLRWDVWRANTELQNYYVNLGARLLRVVDVEGRHSGALFELSKAPAPLDVTTVSTPVPIAALPSHHKHVREDRDEPLTGDQSGNQPGYEEVQLVDDWIIPNLGATSGYPATNVSVSAKSEPVLFDAGDGWHLKGFFSQPVDDTWPPHLNPTLLRRGHAYRLQLGDRPDTIDLYGDDEQPALGSDRTGS